MALGSMQQNRTGSAILEVAADAQTLTLTLAGRLDVDSVAKLWNRANSQVKAQGAPRLVVETSGVDYCDGAGIGLLVALCRCQHQAGGAFEVRGLRPQFRQLFDLFDPCEIPEPPGREGKPASFPVEIGRASYRVWIGIRDLLSFVGELFVALLLALRRPLRIRWSDTLLVAEKAGVNALPIVALVSFLVGLIMAFQAAIPMRQFGVEIYVANLIGLSMLRELGPLMTALVLAGRSGSAFAAELGTMKVNEEVDALATMGLDPVRFLVVSRVLAAMLAIPLLTVFADVVSIMGGSVVLLSLGYPLVSYIKQLLWAVTWVDAAGGLAKSFVFGLIVAGIGCMQGLRTQGGASAVGDSATRAVVAGNVLIIIADGVFSVLFYYLGI